MSTEQRILALRAALYQYENWFAEHPGEPVPAAVARLATAALAVDDAEAPNSCIWTYVEATPLQNAGWIPACFRKRLHSFDTSSPILYGYQYCPHCGKLIREAKQ